jgi:mono/diheme cytochrome c family protein
LVEVPEHLLQRSRERRAALGLGGGDDAGSGAAAEGDAAPATTSETAAPAVATPAAAPAEVEKPPPPPPPPYVQAAVDRKRIPYWAMPVVFLLPLWVVLYAGTLSEADTGELTQLDEGGELYTQYCATCHGAGGGGGVGPQLADGAVLETFPTIESHLEWVFLGSEAAVGGVYGANGKASAGGMPAFGETLTAAEILAVVRYEREVLGGEEIDEELLSPEELLLHPDELPWLSEDGTMLLGPDGEPLLGEDGFLVAGAQNAAAAEASGTEP